MSNKNCHISDSAAPGPQDVGVTRGNLKPEEATAEVEVEGLSAGGRGIARHDGVVWFVSGGLPGDVARVEVERRRARFVEGRVLSILRPSPRRRTPNCPHQDRCGGCPWMPLSENEQRSWKRRLIVDALIRIGGVADPPVEAIRDPSPPMGYRSRVELSVGPGPGGRPTIGMHHRSPSQGLVDIDRCPVQHDQANAVLASARGFLLSESRAAALTKLTPGACRLLLRRSSATEQILVGLWESEQPFPHARALARHLSQTHPELAGVVGLRARPGQRGGIRIEPLVGSPRLVERIGELEFAVDATTFTQVNPLGANELVRLVVECAGDVRRAAVIDLFGGVGAYSLALAAHGLESATVCDADRAAVASGRRAARRAGLPRVRFVHEPVARFLARARAAGERARVVVANPPRTGLGQRVVDGIAAYRPRRVVVVSCDPSTLARDVKAFGGHGLRPTRVVPVELFPQTAHVEAVVALERADSAD